jgi:hypothetical protein
MPHEVPPPRQPDPGYVLILVMLLLATGVLLLVT